MREYDCGEPIGGFSQRSIHTFFPPDDEELGKNEMVYVEIFGMQSKQEKSDIAAILAFIHRLFAFYHNLNEAKHIKVMIFVNIIQDESPHWREIMRPLRSVEYPRCVILACPRLQVLTVADVKQIILGDATVEKKLEAIFD